MGQIAEDMTNGICCQLCGCYFEGKDGHIYTHNYPAVCWDCWKDLTKEEKKFHVKSDVKTL